ncbi:DUF1801 domain-containing protein [Planosporangium sp. 12N6]|uniref:DUF1801 domain-containing protein n=1 Tax=Planosporangium spinosum TaxID=3402278 RepID=UPI003CF9EFF5
MRNKTAEVDRFVAALVHPLKEGVEQLRIAILDSNEQITEHVKWKAPSFRYGGEDRVTFKLHPRDRLQLIFHRGAKVRDDSRDFVFQDHSGLLTWVTNDRAGADAGRRTGEVRAGTEANPGHDRRARR